MQDHSAVHVDHDPSGSYLNDVDPSAIGGKSAAELPPHYFRSWKFIGFTIAFALGAATATATQPMVAGSLSFISGSFDPSKDSIWVLLSYTLCQSMGFPIMGRLSDIFGRRWFFIGAYLLAFIGYLVAGRAKSLNTVIGGNVLSGLGTSAFIAGTTVPGELVPNNMRYLFYGIVVGTFGPWVIISPGIARVLCVHTGDGWRWIFNIGAILSFVSLVLLILCYYPPDFRHLHTRQTKMSLIKHFDYVGMILYSGSTSAVILGLSWGGQRYPWDSAHVIVPLVVGAVGCVALPFWEHFSKVDYPFIAIKLLKNWNWAVLSICSCVMSMYFYAFNILWVQQLSILYSLSPSKAGWGACTLTGGVVLGWWLSTFILSKFQFLNTKYQLIASTVIVVTFIGAEAASGGSNLPRAIIFSLLGGAGIGYLENICMVGAPLHLDAEDIGVASGLQMSLRTVLSTAASAIFVTILTNQVESKVPSRIVAVALEAGLPNSSALSLVQAMMTGDAAALGNIPDINPAIIAEAAEAAKSGYFESFQTVYYVSIAFGMVAIISACLMDEGQMKSRLTTEVARRLRNTEVRKAPSIHDDLGESKELAQSHEIESS